MNAHLVSLAAQVGADAGGFPGVAEQKVNWILDLDTGTLVPSDGKKQPVLIDSRGSVIRAGTVFETLSYLLGVGTTAARGRAAYEAYEARLTDLASRHPVAGAVLRWLRDPARPLYYPTGDAKTPPEEALAQARAAHPAGGGATPVPLDTASTSRFALRGAMLTGDWFTALAREHRVFLAEVAASEQRGQCGSCGRVAPLVRLSSKPQGASPTTFNLPSARAYGREQNLVAPLCAVCSQDMDTGLSDLIQRGMGVFDRDGKLLMTHPQGVSIFEAILGHTRPPADFVPSETFLLKRNKARYAYRPIPIAEGVVARLEGWQAATEGASAFREAVRQCLPPGQDTSSAAAVVAARSLLVFLLSGERLEDLPLRALRRNARRFERARKLYHLVHGEDDMPIPQDPAPEYTARERAAWYLGALFERARQNQNSGPHKPQADIGTTMAGAHTHVLTVQRAAAKHGRYRDSQGRRHACHRILELTALANEALVETRRDGREMATLRGREPMIFDAGVAAERERQRASWRERAAAAASAAAPVDETQDPEENP